MYYAIGFSNKNFIIPGYSWGKVVGIRYGYDLNQLLYEGGMYYDLSEAQNGANQIKNNWCSLSKENAKGIIENLTDITEGRKNINPEDVKVFKVISRIEEVE